MRSDECVLRWLKERTAVHIVIVLFFVGPVLGLLFSGWSYAKLKFDYLEKATVDFRSIYYRRATANPQIVFLPIDAASVNIDASDQQTIAASRPLSLMLASGFPYPREVYADICDRLINAGAKVVAFDIFFQKPKADDPAFHEAMEKYRDHVVIGMNFSDDFEAGGTSTSSTLSLPPESLLPSQDPLDDRLGYLNFWLDPDGVVRSAQYRTNVENVSQEAGAETQPKLFSLAARAVSKDGPGIHVPDDLNGRTMRFAHLTKFATFPLYQIFEPHIWATTFENGAFFHDKIVLIGPKGDWAKDQLVTPFGQMNGAELHLNAMNALLQNDFLYPASEEFVFSTVIGAGLMALLLALVVVPIGWRFLSALGVLGGYYAALVWAYDGPGWLLPAVGPMSVFGGATAVGYVYDFVLTQLEKLRLRTTLERYNSPNVVKYLLEHTEAHNEMLAGARRPVTLLFSDVRGFTTLAESGDSHAVVTQLNEYLTAMVGCVFRFDGTLDCFMGDGIMAAWGSIPFNQGPKGDAANAVRAALAMITELRRLNAKWRAAGAAEWQVGIGLNHGQVIVGDIGSQQHKEYATIGDAVNLASRIESLTKEYHVEILIGESVAELVRDQFHLKTVDLVRAKGKKVAVEVFAVLMEKSVPLSADEQKFLSLYEEGIVHLRRRDFATAKALLSEARQLKPDDYLAGYHLKACLDYIDAPPDASWTGVRVMTKK